jgi:hypothetical protein
VARELLVYLNIVEHGLLLCGALLLWRSFSAKQHQVSTLASRVQSAAEPGWVSHLLPDIVCDCTGCTWCCAGATLDGSCARGAAAAAASTSRTAAALPSSRCRPSSGQLIHSAAPSQTT